MELLDLHYEAFFGIVDVAERTGHPVPMDTRGWSQILVSVIYGVKGVARKKGADLMDGSDVKAANTWNAIDTPRFNGVIKAGTKSETAGSVTSLDSMPHLFFVLWDQSTVTKSARCRIWAVRTKEDQVFRSMCEAWYADAVTGRIKSNNFQLQPPRGVDVDIFTTSYGYLKYPKLFHAERAEGAENYSLVTYNPDVLKHGLCELAEGQSRRRR